MAPGVSLLSLSARGLGPAGEPTQIGGCRSTFVLELRCDDFFLGQKYDMRTIFSIDREEVILSQYRVYYKQGGQLLYIQIQRSRDSGGDEYGKLDAHFLSRKEEPL